MAELDRTASPARTNHVAREGAVALTQRMFPGVTPPELENLNRNPSGRGHSSQAGGAQSTVAFFLDRWHLETIATPGATISALISVVSAAGAGRGRRL